MRTNPKYMGFYFPFNLLLFYSIGLLFWKLLFIWFNGVTQVVQPIYSGLRLDFSMICGVFLVGYIPYLVFLISGWKFWESVTKFLNIMLWIFICIIEFSSILLYKEWGSTLDTRALSYVLHPNEAWASVKDFIPLSLVFMGLIIVVSGVKRISMLFKDWEPIRSYYIQSGLFLLFIGPLAFLGLRGGWQKLPIVPSDAFYSSDMKNNFAATNKVWYFLYSLKKSTKITTQYPDQVVRQYQDQYFANECKADALTGSWKNKHIVFIVAEGWSADMVEYLYGKEQVTPFFDSLSQFSIRFTNAFSTGFRTDQGLMSILSGIPSIQSTNMPNVIDKVRKYPSLPAAMKSAGRQTSFIYGGDLNFSNLYNYLTIMGFDTILRDKDFDSAQKTTDWGVPDHITVDKAVSVMNGHNSMFFSTLLLLSSHSPFEVPVPNKFTGMKGIKAQYMSSVSYSDMAMRRFFDQAKLMPWYNDAIFVITSDHGSTHTGWAGMEDHNRFRIPLIIFDPQMTFSKNNKVYQMPCNHFDLPKTITNMVGANNESFIFGRDIFCETNNRKAYWNVDVEAGAYGLSNSEIVSLMTSKDSSYKESVLFLDMAKRWFNTL